MNTSIFFVMIYFWGARSGSMGNQLYRHTHPNTIELDGIDEEIITRLMTMIYRKRHDLQITFNLSRPEAQTSFAKSFEVSGEREYSLSPVLTQQHLIQKMGCTTPFKKKANSCYRLINILDAPARKIAPLLPKFLQDYGRKSNADVLI